MIPESTLFILKYIAYIPILMMNTIENRTEDNLDQTTGSFWGRKV